MYPLGGKVPFRHSFQFNLLSIVSTPVGLYQIKVMSFIIEVLFSFAVGQKHDKADKAAPGTNDRELSKCTKYLCHLSKELIPARISRKC